MSRIGNKPISLKGVNFLEENNIITLSFNNKSIKLDGYKNLTFNVESDVLNVKRQKDDKESRSRHGLIRSLINNAIIGLTDGYKYEMFLQGIGYRVQLKGSNLEFSLGYSHPVLYKAPEGVNFKVLDQNKFVVTSIDKQLIGQVCAEIKALRKKDAYKGKGIYFAGETIRKKPGKSVK